MLKADLNILKVLCFGWPYITQNSNQSSLIFLTKITLSIAGLIALGIGAATVVFMHTFMTNSGIVLTDDVSISNDIHALEGGLFASGTFLLSAFFIVLIPSLVAATPMYFLRTFAFMGNISGWRSNSGISNRNDY